MLLIVSNFDGAIKTGTPFESSSCLKRPPNAVALPKINTNKSVIIGWLGWVLRSTNAHKLTNVLLRNFLLTATSVLPGILYLVHHLFVATLRLWLLRVFALTYFAKVFRHPVWKINESLSAQPRNESRRAPIEAA
ncbi:unnamed protein product, partial [Laminaria digitata]